MRLLLDTHALLWWLDGDAKLSPAARTAIGNEAHPVWVSAVVSRGQAQFLLDPSALYPITVAVTGRADR